MVPTHPHTLLNGILNLVLTKQREKNAEWHMHQDKLTITSPLPLQIHFAHQFRGETTPDHIKIKNFPQWDFPCSLLQPDSPIMSDIKDRGGEERKMVLTGRCLSWPVYQGLLMECH